MKRIDGGYKMIEFFSARWNSADTIVDVAAVEFRFGAAVLIQNLVFNISYKKIGIARSHSCAHRYTINLFVIVAGEWKTIKR